jgi:hypothetical protein
LFTISKGLLVSTTARIIALSVAFLCLSFRPLQAQLTYGSEIRGDVVLPVGSFGDAFSTGFGGTLGMYFDVEPNVRITLSGGYLSTGVNEDGIQDLYREAGGTGTISPTGSAKSIPLLLGVQLITPGPVRLYGSFEAGIYIYSLDVDATITDAAGTANVEIADETRTEFGVNLGFGALLPLHDNVSLAAGARYHFVKTSEFRSTSGGASELTLTTNQFLTLSVGINYSFAMGSAD